MRIPRRLSILPLLLALAACDDGLLPGTDPIHGEWAAPLSSVFRPNLDIDWGEHRYTFRPDGTYEATTLFFHGHPLSSRVVYEGETKGEYRLEPGGFARNVKSYRWREAGMSRWQDQVVAPNEFGPPEPYTISGNQLILHLGPSQGEHGEPIPARDWVYTRLR